MFISEFFPDRIRRVDKDTGIITTYAGIEHQCDDMFCGGFSGDGGPATEAELDAPLRIIFDENDNLIFSDTWNARIRIIDAETGIIESLMEPQWTTGAEGLALHNGRLFYPLNNFRIRYYLYGEEPAATSTLSVSPTSIDFGYIPLRTTSNPIQVTLTNEGDADVTIDDVQVTELITHAFLVTGAPTAIPAGGTAQLDVQFAPGEFLPPPPPFEPEPIFRINAGGSSVTEFDLSWSEDSEANPSSLLDPGSANIETTEAAISLDASVPEGTPTDLFTTKRIDANKVDPIMSWDLPVSEGVEYEVNLFFVEMSRCSIGNRVFDIEIEGALVQEALDIYAEAGTCHVGIRKRLHRHGL